jgi:hypothetical protein
VRLVLSQALEAIHCLEKADQQAAETLFWAQEINAPISISRARSQLIQLTLSKGHVSTVIPLIQQNQTSEHRLPFNADYEDNTLATCLFHLGSIDLALETFKTLEPSQRVQIARQRFEALAA